MNSVSCDKLRCISNLHNEVYCRVKPSKIVPGGCGLIAIRKIYKGVTVLPAKIRDQIWISEDEIGYENINDELKDMLESFYEHKDGKILVNMNGLNDIGVDYFINHSDKPTCKYNEFGETIALRNISVGEEITVDYRKYFKHPKFLKELKNG